MQEQLKHLGEERKARMTTSTSSTSSQCPPIHQSYIPPVSHQVQVPILSGTRVAVGMIVVLEAELRGVLKGFELQPKAMEDATSSRGVLVLKVPQQRNVDLFIAYTSQQGQGNGRLAAEVLREMGVEKFISIGCSGSIGNHSVGDVIVSTDIDHYDHRLDVRDTEGKMEFTFGGQPFVLDPEIVELPRFFHAKNSTLHEQWRAESKSLLIDPSASDEDKKKLEKIITSEPSLHVEPISSGNMIIKSENFKQQVRGKRKKTINSVDTETAGIAEWIQQQRNPFLKFFTIRGLSDDGVNKAFLDSFHDNGFPRYQVLATQIAANLLKLFLQEGLFSKQEIPPHPLDAWRYLNQAQKKSQESLNDLKSALQEKMDVKNREWAYFVDERRSFASRVGLLCRKKVRPNYSAAFKESVMKFLKSHARGKEYYQEIMKINQVKKLEHTTTSIEFEEKMEHQLLKMEIPRNARESESLDWDQWSESLDWDQWDNEGCKIKKEPKAAKKARVDKDDKTHETPSQLISPPTFTSAQSTFETQLSPDLGSLPLPLAPQGTQVALSPIFVGSST